MSENVSPFERFRKFAFNTRPPVVIPVPPPPTEEDLIVGELREMVKRDEIFATLVAWLDLLTTKSRALHRSSLTNHPLMCHYDGQVAALESLKAILTSLRRESVSSPHLKR
jgi:hypothetical protein